MVTMHVEFRGPLFDGTTEREVRRAISATVQDLVERGEGMVKGQLFSGHGLVTGTLRRSIVGTMREPFAGLVQTNVIYGPWIEGVSNRNQTTRFKGYQMFRRSAQAMQRMVPTLLRQHIARARLN